MKHVLPIMKFSIAMAALHYLIPSMQQRGPDLNTASYQIISQAKRNSLPMYFVSQCQRKTTVGFFQSSLNSQTLSYIYWMNKLPEIKLFLQKDVYNRTSSKSDWGNSDIDKRKTLLLHISKMIFHYGHSC